MNTGLIKEYLPSERDYDYEVVCGSVKRNYPSYFRLLDENTGTQKDQGDIGACVAMTITSIAEEWWRRQLGTREEHSEGFVYGAFRSDKSTNSGLSVAIAFQKWVEIGTIPKKYFDMLIEMPEIKKIVARHPEFKELAQRYRLNAYSRLRTNGTSTRDEQIKDALTKYQYGLVAVDDAHCIQLVGWDDENNKYILKDSYGTDRGDNGYVYKKKDTIEQVWLPIFEEVQFPFEDVPVDAWYYKDVKNMYFAGMMNGTSETTFEPDRPITRAEAAALINRVLKSNDDRAKLLNDIFNEKLDWQKELLSD